VASNNDPILDASKELYAASKTISLAPREKQKLDGFAMLVNKNRELLSIPEQDARQEYLKLDENLQSTLKQFNPDAKFAQEPDSSIFGNIKKNVVSPVLDNLSKYSSRLTEPYRAARVKMVDNVSWDKAWEMARDGNSLFDKQRELKIDNYYDSPVAKIAKQISTGKTIGEVLSTLTTPEEIDAMRRMLEGDKTFQNAIADYDTAKISLGRDLFYEAFSIDAGDFGANRKAFNVFSGAADLATQIAFDPTTYIPVAGQGYKIAQLSILKIAGDAAKVEKAFNAPLVGKAVNNFFDTVGPEIKKFAEGDKAQQTEAFSKLTRFFGKDISLEGINDLAKNQVYDAVSAKKFLSESDNAMSLVNGKFTGAFPTLPTYGVVRQLKDTLKESVVSAVGINKIKPVKGFDIEGTSILSMLDNAVNLLKTGDINGIQELKGIIKDSQTVAGKFAKNWEIAPGFKTLKIGKKLTEDGKVIDEGLRSTRDVVALARVAGFSRPMADEIGTLWAKANEGQRIKMRDGIVATMAHTMGLSSTDSGRQVLERTLGILKNELYATPLKVNKGLLDSLGSQSSLLKEVFNLSDEAITAGDNITIDASAANGAPRAVALYQLADELSIPPIHEWYREAYKTKNWVIKSLGATFNSRISQGLVDTWSFLTLLPRLGVRSVIEEAMVYGLVAPVKAMTALFTDGFNASRSMRRVLQTVDGQKKGWFDAGRLSIPMNAWYNLFQKGITKELKIAAAEGKPIPELMAIAMMGSRNRLPNVSVKRHADQASQFVKYSYGSKLMEDVSVGASQGQRLDQLSTKGYGSPVAIAKQYGDVVKWNVKFKETLEQQKPYGDFVKISVPDVPAYSNAYYINLTQDILKAVDGNGEVGKIAIRYMDDADTAIAKMVEYLDAHPNVAKRFANAYSEESIDHTRLAFSMYLKSSELFRNADNAISEDLLNLVRKKVVKEDGTSEIVLDAYLDVDELVKLDKSKLPATILGQQYVPVAYNQQGFIKAIVEKGYTWMDRQVATMSREPLFHANYFFYRDKLTRIEDLKYQQLKAKGLSDEAAKNISEKYATEMATELSVKRTLDFVDNPNVRTNFAWSMRNFARFYRATEDFYRRVYRMTVKNPQSIVRLRLASDGLDHSGFIHTDDNGDKYFVFPTDDILTAVIAPVTKLLTGKSLQTPMPLQFTYKVKMLTPSLDPQSSIPTLSGPLSGISMMALQRLMPNFMGPVKDRVLSTALGSRSANARWTDVILPSNVRRAVDALNQDERDSQFASAARKAIVYMAANKQQLPLNATEEQKLAYRQKIEGIAANIVVTRFFLGLVSPVSPQIGFGKDIPDYLKDAGNVNFKAEFNKLVNEVAATGEPDAYNIALQKWSAVNPGLLAYTIGETDANKIATIKKTKQAADWVRSNRDLIQKYPEGSGFFIPYTGDFNFDDYTFLKREGYTESVPVEDFLKRVTVAQDKEAYYDLKKTFDDKLEATGSPSLKANIRDQWSKVKEDFLVDKPLLVQDMETRQSAQQVKNSLNDLRSMISSGEAPNTGLTRKYNDMITIYDKAQSVLDVLTSNTKVQRNQREIIRQRAYQQIQDISAGDPQAEMAVRVLFTRLLGV
jgi:hypothetical protein